MAKKVAVGGTFDRLHKGHKTLLRKAFEYGDRVVVGITSDEMIQKEADPLHTRLGKLRDFLAGSKYDLVILKDPYGPTITDPEIDAIVVTRETEQTAHEINRIRSKKGMKPLEIVIVEMVKAQDGRPISSTRIRKGEIDEEGSLL